MYILRDDAIIRLFLLGMCSCSDVLVSNDPATHDPANVRMLSIERVAQHSNNSHMRTCIFSPSIGRPTRHARGEIFHAIIGARVCRRNYAVLWTCRACFMSRRGCFSTCFRGSGRATCTLTCRFDPSSTDNARDAPCALRPIRLAGDTCNGVRGAFRWRRGGACLSVLS